MVNMTAGCLPISLAHRTGGIARRCRASNSGTEAYLAFLNPEACNERRAVDPARPPPRRCDREDPSSAERLLRRLYDHVPLIVWHVSFPCYPQINSCRHISGRQPSRLPLRLAVDEDNIEFGSKTRKGLGLAVFAGELVEPQHVTHDAQIVGVGNGDVLVAVLLATDFKQPRLFECPLGVGLLLCGIYFVHPSSTILRTDTARILGVSVITGDSPRR